MQIDSDIHKNKFLRKVKMTGPRFGKWIILKEGAFKDKWGAKYNECICECGYIGYVRPDYLKNGKSKGCYSCNKRGTTHGYSRSSTYKIWQGMFGRCNNPKSQSYYLYGARGIKVCKRWHEFENFLIDMGERPKGLTLDRIDPDGGYELNNCRWSTIQENLANRRISKLHSGKYQYVKKAILCQKCLDKFIIPINKEN